MNCQVIELKQDRTDTEDEVYVLDFAFSPSTGALAASLSTSVAALISPATGSVVSSIMNQFPINELGFASESSAIGPFSLFTLSNSRCALWDVRTPEQPASLIIQNAAYERECSSGVFGKGYLNGDLNSGTLFCAGDHSGSLSFWDTRMPGKQMGLLEDMHTEPITQVKFHPSAGNVLFTGGEDALVQKFDLNARDPDDSLICTYNLEQFPRRMKFFGAKLEYCFVSTQAETITVLDLTSDDPVASFSNPLGGLSEMWNAEISTLVNCHWDSERQQLSVFTCDVDGAIQSSYMNASTFGPAFALPCRQKQDLLMLEGAVVTPQVGHSDIVRDIIQIGNGAIVSGGEDSRICIWTAQ